MPCLVIAVISDTHGLLRPEVRSALKGCDHIIHAGDMEDPLLPSVLASFAPATIVRGNCDRRCPMPLTQTVDLGGRLFHVLHDLSLLDMDPSVAGVAVVVSGHTHVPSSQVRKGVLYFNPGSAGPARYGKPISMGRIAIEDGTILPELITL